MSGGSGGDSNLETVILVIMGTLVAGAVLSQVNVDADENLWEKGKAVVTQFFETEDGGSPDADDAGDGTTDADDDSSVDSEDEAVEDPAADPAVNPDEDSSLSERLGFSMPGGDR